MLGPIHKDEKGYYITIELYMLKQYISYYAHMFTDVPKIKLSAEALVKFPFYESHDSFFQLISHSFGIGKYAQFGLNIGRIYMSKVNGNILVKTELYVGS